LSCLVSIGLPSGLGFVVLVQRARVVRSSGDISWPGILFSGCRSPDLFFPCRAADFLAKLVFPLAQPVSCVASVFRCRLQLIFPAPLSAREQVASTSESVRPGLRFATALVPADLSRLPQELTSFCRSLIPPVLQQLRSPWSCAQVLVFSPARKLRWPVVRLSSQTDFVLVRVGCRSTLEPSDQSFSSACCSIIVVLVMYIKCSMKYV
jgi:hypothetical protein